ncbi:Flagellar motor rotation protein MotB [Candidatus Syntrophocurvum alkaliphilum]|uniref:Flagellar motor rotation protein MotB n=1 Tax=Candidatus Syntrophocurvum alkaliphilum TaxID=2293317 RepID=A0A6I6DMD3_9FIRM|nr:flagellar motor protein MotB [Candidatus Syntrophocurvum alkaliphilum]QGU00232.1 Flagellar motor rotation protein MotB [Candidatus Syntrophocurvum alkaliphilum]
MVKRKKKHEEHMDESWLIPYADMLTLLLALFVILFAISQVDQDKFDEIRRTLETVFVGGAGVMEKDIGIVDDSITEMIDEAEPSDYAKEDRQLHQYKVLLDYYFKEKGIDGFVSNVVTEQGLLITIQDVALFESGRAELHPEAKDVLKDLADILTELENPIQIAGHTDNVPINTRQFPSNWELSFHRAINVMYFMLNNDKLEADRFSIVAYGEYRPRETNETAEGRALNRRVELLIQRIHTP